MKIDTTKITGYAEMTAEEKIKALEELEVAEPTKDDSDEIKKYKQLVDKAAAEASEYKKKYQASLSEADRKELERKEKEQKLVEELNAYKERERVSKYTASFLAAGFDEDGAKRLAAMLPEGMSDDFFLAHKELIEAEKQRIAIKNINDAPKPSVGSPVTGSEVYDAQTASLRKHMGLK